MAYQEIKDLVASLAIANKPIINGMTFDFIDKNITPISMIKY